MAVKNLQSFYTSDKWNNFRQVLMNERANKEDGYLYCEYCKKPIMQAYDCIAHHIEELTHENVTDVNISLNSDNIMLIHHKCHNAIHERYAFFTQRVYLVHGSPLAGKSSFVERSARPDDLILDMDKIWECISNAPEYIHPERLKTVAFAMRKGLLDHVRMRSGKWRTAWVIGGFPLRSERERLIKTLGAEAIHVNTSKQVCESRASERPKEWGEYVADYWRKFQP